MQFLLLAKEMAFFFASDQQVSQVRLSEMGTFYVWNAAKKRRFLKKSWHTTYKDFNHLFYKAPNLTAGLQGVLYGREVFLSSGSNISLLQLGVYRAGFSASFPCYFSYLPTHPGFQNPAWVLKPLAETTNPRQICQNI